MTITVAVTGGIGAGKSTVSGLLAARGARVVDSDKLAREVVGTGTPGLAAVAERFGPGVLSGDGTLDRAALASIVFADPSARKHLEAITHPLVRARFAELQASAPPGSVVVNDLPLLTTASVAAAFHLVIGVGAPESVRISRLVDRGLTASDAAARIAAQIDDTARRPLCDVWIDNGAGPADVRKSTDLLWRRLAEYAANVETGHGAARGGPRLVPYNAAWPAAAARLINRLRHAVGDRPVEHIGSTAVDGLWAKDVIDLQLGVAGPDDLTALEPLLTDAGFPPAPTLARDTPHPDDHGEIDPELWRKRVHLNADPGRAVNVHLRLTGSPGWVWALRFRDWLRADESARADYLSVKRRQAEVHAADATTAGYAEAKEDWLVHADVRARAWATATGWLPPELR